MQPVSLGAPGHGSQMQWAINALKTIERASNTPSFASQVTNDSAAPSLGTDLAAVLGALGIPLTIADQAAVTIDLSGYANAAALVEIASSTAGGPNGSLWARCDGSNACVTVAFAAGPTLSFTTGPLTGTTGTSGHVTMSADVTGLFYIENRSGASITCVARLLGA